MKVWEAINGIDFRFCKHTHMHATREGGDQHLHWRGCFSFVEQVCCAYLWVRRLLEGELASP